MAKRRRILPLVLVVLFAAMAGGGAGAFVALSHDLPQIQNLEGWRPPVVTRVYAGDGTVLGEWFAERREPVPLKDIPAPLVQGLLATEDRAFFSHVGVDVRGVARAVYHNLVSGGLKEGASTITQQLAKNLFLTPEKTLKRKLREAALSLQLERRYTKEEILEIYLNTVYFGSGAYGVRVAADVFFGKTLDQLSISECALIAGMPKAPSRFSPLVNMDAARIRRNLVLWQMADMGVISQAVYQAAAKEPIVTAPKEPGQTLAPYFVAHVRGVLEENFGDHSLNEEGLSVRTTLDLGLQQKAEAALVTGLEALGKRLDGKKYEPGKVEGALVCLDVKTGDILAMAGGHDYTATPFNRATQARRQPGSSFKPLVYALAVEKGATQSDLILDAPVSYPSGKPGKLWTPQNYTRDFEGEISIRRALSQSRNIPTIKLVRKLSPERIVEFAHRMGIGSTLGPNLSLALGTSEVTLLEMVSAYAAFPGNGVWHEPRAVREVLDRNSRPLALPRQERRAVMSESAAAVMVNLLEAVVLEGTGKSAASLGRPVAGKTGTTNDCKDAWFVGFTPSLAVGVWVGRDDGTPLGAKETGGRAALPVWKDFMEKALEGAPPEPFTLPPDTVAVRVDPRYGTPVAADSGRGVLAVYRKGTEPAGARPAVMEASAAAGGQ
jgi:penicillin-binding protein 1A